MLFTVVKDMNDFYCDILYRKGVLMVGVGPYFHGFMSDHVQDGALLSYTLYPPTLENENFK